MKDGELRVGVKSCTAGRYSSGSVDECASCGTGFSNDGASKCEFCGPGKYMHEEATSKECLLCPAGKYSDTGANSIAGCNVCELGFVSDAGEITVPVSSSRKKSPTPSYPSCLRRVGLLQSVQPREEIVIGQYHVRDVPAWPHERHSIPDLRPLRGWQI